MNNPSPSSASTRFSFDDVRSISKEQENELQDVTKMMKSTTIMDDPPPSSIFVCLDSNDRSGLVWPQCDDDGGISPCSYDRLNKTHPSKTKDCDLKFQIAQEKIDLLSSKLSQCQVENESIKTEKVIMIGTLTSAIHEKPATRRKWFSKEDHAGPVQVLTDNSRRQGVVVEGMRKSYHSYGTATTAPLDLSDYDLSAQMNQEAEDWDCFNKQVGSMPSFLKQDDKVGSSGDSSEEICIEKMAHRRDALPATNAIKNAGTAGAEPCKFENLLLGFGGSRRPSSMARRWHSHTEGVASRKSEDLLVDFEKISLRDHLESETREMTKAPGTAWLPFPIIPNRAHRNRVVLSRMDPLHPSTEIFAEVVVVGRPALQKVEVVPLRSPAKTTPFDLSDYDLSAQMNQEAEDWFKKQVSSMPSFLKQDDEVGSSGDGNEEICNRVGSEKMACRSYSMPATNAIKNAGTAGAEPCKFENLLLGFGGSRRPSSMARRWHSHTEGVASRKSEDLLVDFDETLRLAQITQIGF